jgi:hypothetical protein
MIDRLKRVTKGTHWYQSVRFKKLMENEDNLNWFMDNYAPGLRQNCEQCPECFQPTEKDELKMFGGLCEECSAAFDE